MGRRGEEPFILTNAFTAEKNNLLPYVIQMFSCIQNAQSINYNNLPIHCTEYSPYYEVNY